MFTSVNPATGAEIATYEELKPEEVEAKLQCAADAFARWRTTSPGERAELLSRIAGQYETHKARLARTVTEEMGKTYKSAVAEIEKCIAGFRYYAKRGPAMLEPEKAMLANGRQGETHLLPQGPVLAVMPWNFPFWQTVRFLAPTIMAGNVGLLKHASIVQGCAGLMEEMMAAAGAPEGLFQNLRIKSGAVASIIADERIVAVTLTGSEGAGASVAEVAGRHLKKVVLELGGSDPFIVMPSADINAAIPQAVTARVQNTGQSCICGKRMIVHADIHDDFLKGFTNAMLAVRAGDPMDEATDMGPLSSFEQLDTVLDQLERAKAAGGTLTGGERIGNAGAFISAGVLTGVPWDSEIAREEIFGPVAMVFKAKDADEAIRIANAVPFGLGSSVWTNDEAEKRRFITEIEAGMTAVNQMLASAPEVPFGGIKRSGHGRELGREGLREFANLKTVML
ncbi:NAD-dependent succinate-semialdehyde dehydrogenase [Allosphingosinicella flava]|uniref:NAD-dependent succinate-semialdehyde dehydrogenase n=1 Tax=Allosphingosinicella flava TaxID=2771430 RepID=A0A7T2LN28_9SPHN|nr:NAD-dependent succinate-semialdehyde dehydrogenase [Sphingosinicella flava]QPQ55762.1 NAD-dependent succinate-semialdehyde dehydrogenase [Sphingosinicella flava]